MVVYFPPNLKALSSRSYLSLLAVFYKDNIFFLASSSLSLIKVLGFLCNYYSPSFLSATDSTVLVGSTTEGFIGFCLTGSLEA